MPADPIVIDPPGFDAVAAWKPCAEAAENLTYSDGSVNWKAAFSASPGVCSCPACQAMHWAWGRRQRCTACGFEYPVGWLGMYAWGCHAGARGATDSLTRERMSHPYFRYGYENPADDPCTEKHQIDWRKAFPHDVVSADGGK